MRDSSSWLGPVCLIFCVFVYSVFCFWLSLVVITGRIDSFVELNVVSQKKKTPNLTRCSFDKHRLIFSLRYVWLMARHWCLSSVTLVHPTQTVKLFGNIFYMILYIRHLGRTVQTFTKIGPREPVCRGR